MNPLRRWGEWALRGAATLTGPAGAGMPVRLLLQSLQDAAPGQRVRGHIDLACTDKDTAVAWHVDHGARVAGTFQYWTVLTDPAEHEYCLVARPPWK